MQQRRRYRDARSVTFDLVVLVLLHQSLPDLGRTIGIAFDAVADVARGVVVAERGEGDLRRQAGAREKWRARKGTYVEAGRHTTTDGPVERDKFNVRASRERCTCRPPRSTSKYFEILGDSYVASQSTAFLLMVMSFAQSSILNLCAIIHTLLHDRRRGRRKKRLIRTCKTFERTTRCPGSTMDYQSTQAGCTPSAAEREAVRYRRPIPRRKNTVVRMLRSEEGAMASPYRCFSTASSPDCGLALYGSIPKP